MVAFRCPSSRCNISGWTPPGSGRTSFWLSCPSHPTANRCDPTPTAILCCSSAFKPMPPPMGLSAWIPTLRPPVPRIPPVAEAPAHHLRGRVGEAERRPPHRVLPGGRPGGRGHPIAGSERRGVGTDGLGPHGTGDRAAGPRAHILMEYADKSLLALMQERHAENRRFSEKEVRPPPSGVRHGDMGPQGRSRNTWTAFTNP